MDINLLLNIHDTYDEIVNDHIDNNMGRGVLTCPQKSCWAEVRYRYPRPRKPGRGKLSCRNN